jgi:hypothetical protein
METRRSEIAMRSSDFVRESMKEEKEEFKVSVFDAKDTIS